jgi:hypothetical protein
MSNRIIWSNKNLKLEDWADYFKELEDDTGDTLTEDQKYNLMEETNSLYLDDERINLDIQLSGELLVIADIGRWNGRVSGYRTIKSGNIKDILSSDCDYVEWFCDRYNCRCTAIHHDGTNNYIYREVKEGVDIDILKEKIYNKKFTTQDISRYTKSIRPYIANVYGWWKEKIMAELFKKLEYAKNAVKAMLENEKCCVDFHGLTYWASEVERLRKEIKEML